MDNFNNSNNQNPYPPNYYAGQGSNDGAPNGANVNNTTPPPQGGFNPPPQGNYKWDFNTVNSYTEPPRPPKKNKGLKIFGGIVGAVLLIFVACFAIYGGYVAITGNAISIMPSENDNTPVELPDLEIKDKPEDFDGGLSNSAIFKKVSPSVVGVITYSTNGYEQTENQGSGIIMSADGYIITNAHVVDGGTSFEVVLEDGTSHSAVVIGSDTQTDLAVIKIDSDGDLPVAEFGNSDQLEVGERVVAIGNPGGLQFANSLTVGYVSALKRTLTKGDAGYALDCIQTDAAINPGNSGGPLINAYGQVIAINSAKISSEHYEGMGFAIPINDAMPIIEDLIKNGKVTGRAMLGVTVSEMSPLKAQLSGLPMGLIVKGFAPNADIAQKGVRINDIITKIDGQHIYKMSSCIEVLKTHKPGDTVTVSIFRIDNRGKASSFDVDIVLSGS